MGAFFVCDGLGRAIPRAKKTGKHPAVPDKSVYSWANIGISIGGGLAGAAVFAVLSKSTLAGFFLAHLAPLPLMIVALGLGVGHGATAAIIGTLLLSVWPNPLFGMSYGLLVAAPAWLSCYAVAGAPWGRRDLLTGHLSSWAVLALCVTLAGGIVFFLGVTAFSHGTIEEPLSYVQGQFYFKLDAMLKEHQLAEEVTAQDLERFTRLILPATFAGYGVLAHTLNLWIAGRLTQISHMLKLPWPDIAVDFMLPRAVAIIFMIAGGLAALDGFPGAAALVIAVPLGFALAFQGLAVMHFWLRGSKSSVLVLSIIYFFLGALGAPMVLFTLLGMLDALLRFRDRKAAADVHQTTPQ
ncbi:MAG: DUF2232 domain-containing protein [Methylocystis sp.]